VCVYVCGVRYALDCRALYRFLSSGAYTQVGYGIVVCGLGN
jgi:hypothetical protein